MIFFSCYCCLHTNMERPSSRPMVLIFDNHKFWFCPGDMFYLEMIILLFCAVCSTPLACYMWLKMTHCSVFFYFIQFGDFMSLGQSINRVKIYKLSTRNMFIFLKHPLDLNMWFENDTFFNLIWFILPKIVNLSISCPRDKA